MKMTCPNKQDLFEFLVGRLPAVESEEVGDHLDTCPACQAMMATLDEAGDTLVARLRRRTGEDPLAADPFCQQAVARAAAIVADELPLGDGVMDAPTGNPSLVQLQAEDGRSEPAPELVRLGEYELFEKLGEGGMGAVYKAMHTKLKRIVAIKVLSQHRMEDQRAVARFEREMEAVGRVDHPNIVRAMDAREIEGKPVLVMEYVAGLNLAELVRRLGPLSIADACELVRQAALGLECVHENGLVHRDIKPSNLMLTASPLPGPAPESLRARSGRGAGGDGTRPQVKILDLGLALLNVDRPAGEMTAAGQMMGTADYVAPEQVTDSHNVDIRADIYGLGCTLYKLLAGRAPFSGPEHKGSFEKMLAHVQQTAPPIRVLRTDVPEELAAILDRMMAKSPADRFSTPGEVAAAMSPFAAGSDLAGFMAQAASQAHSAAVSEKTVVSTDEFVSSALTGTDPGESFSLGEESEMNGEEASALARPAPRRRKAVPVAVGLLLAGMFAGIVFGVVLWVNRTRIEVPDGAHVAVRDDGAVEINTPNATAALRTSAGGDQAKTPRPAYKPGPPLPKPHVAPIQIDPEPLPQKAGDALSRLALVSNPAPIPGLRSWTIETTAHRARIVEALPSPDGRRFATASYDGTVRLWDSETGRLLYALIGHDHSIASLAWSPDGRYLASGSPWEREGTICLWDGASGLLLGTYRGNCFLGSALAWSPDGKTLLSNMGDTLRLWEVRSGRLRPRPEVVPLAKGFGDVNGLAWSPDGKSFAAGGAGRILEIWDSQSLALRHAITARHRIEDLAWSPDGKVVGANCPKAGGVVLWDAESGHPRGDAIGAPAKLFAWSPDGTVLAMGHGRNYTLWDVERRIPLDPFGQGERNFDACGYVSCVAWFGNGNRLLCTSHRGSFRMDDIGSAKQLYTLSGHGAEMPAKPWPDFIYPTLSPTANIVATPDAVKGIWMWQIGSSFLPKQLDPDREDVWTRVFWSHNGATLAAIRTPSDAAKGAQVWNVPSGKCLAEFSVPDAWPVDAALSPDGKMLVTTGPEDIELRDAATGKTVRKLGIHGNLPAYADQQCHAANVAWSPDGKLLAAATTNGVVLCEPATGTIVKTLSGSTDWLAEIAWSPDGRSLASARVAPPGTKVNVWDVDSGETRLAFDAPVPSPMLLRWLSDGRTLIVGNNRGNLGTCDADTGKLIRMYDITADDVSADGHLAVEGGPAWVRLHSLPEGRALCTLLCLRDGRFAVISPDGHFRGSPDVEKDLVYVVQTDAGQETLTPEEFSKRYGWKNDPAKVKPVEEKKAEAGEGKAAGGAGGSATPGSGDQAKMPLPAYKPGPPLPKPEVPPIQIDPEPLPWKAGDALSKLALVTNPAPIPEVRSWTIDTAAHRARVAKALPSPDGRRFATASYDGTVRLWDSETGKLMKVLVGHDMSLYSLAWSPDGKYLASGASWDFLGKGSVRLWDAESGLLVNTCRATDDSLILGIALAWSPDGKMLAVSQSDRIRLWEARSGKLEMRPEVLSLGSAFGNPTALVWSPDGKSFAAGGDGKILRIWDSPSCALRHTIEAPDVIVDLAWSPDGRSLGGACASSGFVLWDAESGQAWGGDAGWPKWATHIAWTPDGAAAVLGDTGKGYALWDFQRRLLLETSQAAIGGSERVGSVACFGDGRRVLFGTARGSLRIDEIASGKPLCDSLGHGTIWQGHQWWNSFYPAVSPAGTAIAFPDPVDGVWQWPMVSSSLPSRLDRARENTETRIVWSGDGTTLAAKSGRADAAQDAQVWSIPSGKCIGELSLRSALPGDIAISPDGKTLAAAGPEDIELRDASNGNVLRRVAIHARGQSWPGQNRTVSLAWSPDGKMLAAAAENGVALCDPVTGEILKMLSGPVGPLVGIAWSADGRSVVSGPDRRAPYADQHVFVWDVHSGEVRRSFDPQMFDLKLLRWLSDGRTLILTNHEQTGVFDTDSGKLIRMLDTSADDVSVDGRFAVLGGPAWIRVLSLPEGRTTETLLCLRDGRFAVISPDGHFRGSPDVEKELVYVVQTDKGQETLTPEEFSKRYGWKNDPEKVKPIEEKAEGGGGKAESGAGSSAAPGSGDQAKTPLPAYKPGPPLPKPAVAPIHIDPEPLPWKAGDALSKLALVTNPPPIPGVRSWTIDTTAHRGSIVKVLPGPDGRRVATASCDGTLRIWESDSGRLIRTLVGQDGAIYSLAWSPDGRYLASDALRIARAWEWTIRLWDAESGLLVGTHRLTSDPSLAGLALLAWSPDGKTLASAGLGMLRLWQVQSGRLQPRPEIITLGSDFGEPHFLVWSPDAKSFAASGDNGILQVWDLQSLTLRHTIKAPDMVSDLAWSPDGRVLGSACGRGGLVLWDAESGQQCGEALYKPSPGLLAWTPDGATVVVPGGGGDDVAAWSRLDVERRTLLGPFGGGVRGAGDFFLTSMASFHNGDRVAFGTATGSFRIDEIASGKELHFSGGHGTQRAGRPWKLPKNCFYPTICPTGNSLTFPDPVSGVWLWQFGSSPLPKPLDAAQRDVASAAVWSHGGKHKGRPQRAQRPGLGHCSGKVHG